MMSGFFKDKNPLVRVGCMLVFLLGNVDRLSAQPSPIRTESVLEVVNVRTGKTRVIFRSTEHMEAPNWSPDGGYFVVNSRGLLWKIPAQGLDPDAFRKLSDADSVQERIKPSVISTDPCNRNNNDHGFSPDGRWLAISHHPPEISHPTGNSTIYIVPATGGIPRRVTDLYPSYWHGWSPDASMLTYCAERNGNYDVFTISVNGGRENRLTDNPGLDDGPEYAPDGRTIYFNTFRNQKMQIWRMDADGKNQQPLITDTCSNWFPHPSPDGQQLAYIAYLEDQGQQHPANQKVQIRLLDLNTGGIRNLTPVFNGGQGSFNVPSWSPNGDELAYIRYPVISR